MIRYKSYNNKKYNCLKQSKSLFTNSKTYFLRVDQFK